jgi:hypothetical protein
VNRSIRSKPDIATLAARFASDPQINLDCETRQQAPGHGLYAQKFNLPIKSLIAARVGVVFVPAAIVFVLLWQGTIQVRRTAAEMPRSGGPEYVVQKPNELDIALTSPIKVEAKAGTEIDFALAIDATETLPSRSIVAVSGLPYGASFSEGRPYGASGWSLRPDEIGDLRMRLPLARSGAADLRIELIAPDGAVLAQSETRLSISTEPAEDKQVVAIESYPFEQMAEADAPKLVETIPPMPERKPVLLAAIQPRLKVRSVKVVSIEPPKTTRPHDGAYALSEPAEALAEWVEIVRPVDMHAKPQQSSETVRVMEKGVKMRVTAREKNWVQVSDATSTRGWIYSRFLKPTQSPAQ